MKDIAGVYLIIVLAFSLWEFLGVTAQKHKSKIVVLINRSIAISSYSKVAIQRSYSLFDIRFRKYSLKYLTKISRTVVATMIHDGTVIHPHIYSSVCHIDPPIALNFARHLFYSNVVAHVPNIKVPELEADVSIVCKA